MLTEPEFYSLTQICLSLRESDKTEIYNVRPHDSPLQLAMESLHAVRNMGRGRVAWANGRPVAFMAFTENWPGHWDVWMFGTDDFRSGAIELVRWARKEANDILTLHTLHVKVYRGADAGDEEYVGTYDGESAAKAAAADHEQKLRADDPDIRKVEPVIRSGRRLQCDCRIGHDDAHKLIRAMGGVAEGEPMQDYGKDGSAYQRYVWLRKRDSAVLKPHYTRAA